MKAKKSLGQNFLVDEGIIERIVDVIHPQVTDIIFEIGPGTGALTRRLVERSGMVIAIELDRRLIAQLEAEFNKGNFLLLEADALELDWQNLMNSAIERWRECYCDSDVTPRLRVVANLPYYISTAILERLLKLHGRLRDMTLMLQEEVVDRIVSPTGKKDYGYLSLLVQYYCEAIKIFRVPPESFSPIPKVNSAIVKLVFHELPPIEISDEEKFFTLIGAAFAQRRKTILNNLKAARARLQFSHPPEIALENCDIDAMRRAETLSLEEFARLYGSLYTLESI